MVVTKKVMTIPTIQRIILLLILFFIIKPPIYQKYYINLFRSLTIKDLKISFNLIKN